MAYQYVTSASPGEKLVDLGARIKNLAIPGTYVHVSSEAIERADGRASDDVRRCAEQIGAMFGLTLQPEYDIYAEDTSELSTAQDKEEAYIFSAE